MSAVDKKELVRVVKEACDLQVFDVPNYDRTFKELGLDSLDLVSVFLSIEETYGIRIPDEDAKGLITINALAEYLTGHQGDR